MVFDQLELVLRETDHLICALPGGPEPDEILKFLHFNILPKTSFFYNLFVIQFFKWSAGNWHSGGK